MKRRFLSLLLAAALMLGSLPLSAYAEEKIHSGFCGRNVTWALAEDGALTISGSGTMNDYSYLYPSLNDVPAPPWWLWKDEIKTIVIENGVTSIGNCAFNDCAALTSITVPSSVTRMGDRAFWGCASLTDIAIPGSVTSLGYGVFFGCSSLTSMIIPDRVTSIKSEAFGCCTGLTSITIPDSVASIEYGAFDSCTGLTGIALPNSVTSIEGHTFWGCTSLKSVIIPGRVTSIGPGAFLNCSSLSGIAIPNSVTSIGSEAFEGCTSLTSITIPDGVTSIEYSAFFRCSGLTGIAIPDGVTAIGVGAFSECARLTSITIPGSVTSIECGAFSGCAGLKSVVFEGTAPSAGESVFKDVRKDFCIYYQDGAAGWTTPKWNGYPCKPLSEMSPDESRPGPGPDPDHSNTPARETVTSPDGTVTVTVTWPDGKKSVRVLSPAGDAAVQVTTSNDSVMAKVDLPADPGAGKIFDDVKESAWYAEAVDKATAYNLFSGTSDTAFTPNGRMTRGMVAQVLYNLSGGPAYGTETNLFADVKTGVWYEDSVNWAAKAGIVFGTAANEFSPEQSVTREQLVTMLYRYANAIGADTVSAAGLGGFPDGNSVSGYAKPAMEWAVAQGLITGRAQSGGDYIAPQGTATRAEVAAILTRFVSCLKQ